ncbi:MAG: Fic family protein [Acidobacteriota bacterium]
MRKPKKTAALETIILKLLNEEPEVSIRSIAVVAGLSRDDDTERKAIRRALVSLEEKKLIVPKGSGRSRVYALAELEPLDSGKPRESAVAERDPFKGIELSPDSRTLLEYISQNIKERKPVGYDQDFLRSYKPNETFYLEQDQRERLLSVGRVETIERPAGSYARNILDRLLIDLSWNSSRLEGNTYSLLETKRLIELGEEAVGKDASEAQMILNHKAAIEYVVESADENRITSNEICSIHALLSENLLGDPAASGRLRTLIVGIGGSTYLPLENPQVLRECFDLFVEKFNAIADPFEQSIFSIVHLSYLQAFEDVNKRTARLVGNIPLIKANLKPLSFTDVDKAAYVSALLSVYEKNDVSLIRDLYIWAYKRSSQKYTAVQQSLGEPNLLKLKYRESIREIVRSIILEKVAGEQVVKKIRELIKKQNLPETEHDALFNLIEMEIISLHDGNAARFKVRPSEFQTWKELQ